MVALEIAGLHVHQVIEYRAAQVGADAFPQPGNKVKTNHRANSHRKSDDQHKDHGLVEARGVRPGKTLIDQHFDAVAQCQLRACGKHQRHTGTNQASFMGPQKAKQLPQRRQGFGTRRRVVGSHQAFGGRRSAGGFSHS